MTSWQYIKKHPFYTIVGGILFFSALFFPLLLVLIFFIPWVVHLIENPEARECKLPDKPQSYTKGNPFMSAEEKATYLRSDQWKLLKSLALIKARHKCEHCSSPSNLQLHHNTYRNLGAEKLDQVNILCNKCHSQLHEKLGYDRITDYPISKLKD